MERQHELTENAARFPSRRELLGAAAILGAGYALTSAVPASADPFPVRRSQVQINGAPFHLIEQGEGPAILFCHGFPDTSETWLSQMRAVAQAGYRAVALDMRGYGDSYAPEEPSLYSSLHIAADLVGVLDALALPSAVLVGHDWGADHCWRAMVMRPDRFHAMVSLSIPYMPRGEVSHWDALRHEGLEARSYYFDMLDPSAEERFLPAASTIPSVLYWLSASPSEASRWSPNDPARHMLRPSPIKVPHWASKDYVEHTIGAFEKTGFRGGLNYYRALQTTFDLTAAFKNSVVRQPSLYISGAVDGLNEVFHPTPPTLGELRQAMPGLVDHIRLENTGHWIQHEAADRVNAELIKFLGSIEGQR